MVTYRYRALMPSDEIEEFQCASIFGPDEVRKRLANCEVFLHVRKGFRFLTLTGFEEGPYWVWLSEHGTVRCPETPTEANASDMVRTLALRQPAWAATGSH